MKHIFSVISILILAACTHETAIIQPAQPATSTGTLASHINQLTPEELISEFKTVKIQYEKAIDSAVGFDCTYPSFADQTSMEKADEVPMQKCTNKYYGYELTYPNKFHNSLHTEGSSGVASGPGFFYDGISADIYVNSSSTCSPSITGASKTTNISIGEDSAQWGRVDFFDDDAFMEMSDDQLPKCRPSKIISHAAESPLGTETPLDLSHNVAYVLCSEKNGKRVLICMSQQTNDPVIAKQIFETFKWTDTQ